MPLFNGQLSLLARSQRVYLAIDNILHLIGGRSPRSIELPDCVKGLAGSAAYTRPRVAAVFERGGAVLWDDGDREHYEVFGRELESPLATFTPHGWLVVATKEECQVYVSQGRQLTMKAIGPGSAALPIAVLATDQAYQYAVCDSAGRISLYGIPTGASI